MTRNIGSEPSRSRAPSPEGEASPSRRKTPGADEIAAPTLRRAVLADLPDLMAIEELCFAQEAFSEEYYRHLLTQRGSEAYVLETSNLVIGALVLVFAGTSRHRVECVVASVAVRPEFRKQGLGRQFMAYAEMRAQARGARRIRLEVRPDNHPAICLYQSLGYRRSQVLPHYYGFGQNGLLYLKRLTPPPS